MSNERNEMLCELGESYYPVFSSFQAETLALRSALQNCIRYRENTQDKKICILSDSQSLLRHLNSLKLQDKAVSPCIIDIIHSIRQTFDGGAMEVHLVWIPGHSNIVWNERADKLADMAYEN